MNDLNLFTGFSNETFDFLKSLSKNNKKSWFEKNKNIFEKFLLRPMKDLVVELSPFMHSVDPEFEIAPNINKTISRIYRDTRFSHNKDPYKTVMWIVFKRPVKYWQDDPCYFFEISPKYYRFGMGFYYASSKTMKCFRNMIDMNPREFEKIIAMHNKQDVFKLEGEKYKRFVNNRHGEKFQDWYQRKTLCLICNRKIDKVVTNHGLAEYLIFGFDTATPLYHYLRKVKNAVETDGDN